MIIRLLDSSDLTTLIPFMKQTWQQAYPEFYAEEPQIVNSVFAFDKTQAELNDAKTLFVGAFMDHKLVGFAKLFLRQESSFLDKIYVENTLQRQGIGKQLLMLCYRQAIEKGIFSMGLEVEDNNEKAIAFYKKNGFLNNPIKRLYPSTGSKLYYDYIMTCMDLRKSLSQLETPHDNQTIPLDSRQMTLS